MPVRPVQFEQDAQPLQLSPDEELEVKRRMEVLRKLLDEGKKATYKIDLFLVGKRSLWQPVKGIVSFWESGRRFHGGGDVKVYICPARRLGRSDCESLIPDYSRVSNQLYCPKCQSAWKEKEVIGEVLANSTPRNWAVLILKYFQKMDHDADIYLKYSADHLQSTSMLEQVKQMHGDQLNRLRSRRELAIYPLANIIKDVSAGADLLSRFSAFLTS